MSRQRLVHNGAALITNIRINSFLPVDIDAAFTATTSLLMVAEIDPSLLYNHSPWYQRAYTNLDDMKLRGSTSAKLVLSGLKYLDGELAQLSTQYNMANTLPTHLICESGQGSTGPIGIVPSLASGGYSQSLEINFAENFGQQCELSPDQLMDLANSLNLDSLNWPLPPMEDFAEQGIQYSV